MVFFLSTCLLVASHRRCHCQIGTQALSEAQQFGPFFLFSQAPRTTNESTLEQTIFLPIISRLTSLLFQGLTSLPIDFVATKSADLPRPLEVTADIDDERFGDASAAGDGLSCVLGIN